MPRRRIAVTVRKREQAGLDEELDEGLICEVCFVQGRTFAAGLGQECRDHRPAPTDLLVDYGAASQTESVLVVWPGV
jgi:hypothetical protein